MRSSKFNKACCLACTPTTIAPQEDEPQRSSFKFQAQPLQDEGAADEESAPEKPPADNCEITFTNVSRFTHVHLFLNGKDWGDLMTCALERGESITFCLPVGTHTLYVFSNMYQFSDGITLEVKENEAISRKVSSGP